MSEQTNSGKKTLYFLLKLVIGIISLPLILFVLVWYSVWSAEHDANAFCDQIALGADIIPIIAQFERQTGFEKKPGGKVSARHYGYPDPNFDRDGHVFLFPAMMFSNGYCSIALTENGRVKSKIAYFQAD